MSCQFINKFLGTPSDPKAGQCKTKHVLQSSNIRRVRSASIYNVTVITRNLPRKLRVGKIENYP